MSETLRSAVAKLGPERAAQALQAFSDEQDGGSPWVSCALARVYGGRGELYRAMQGSSEWGTRGVWEFAGSLVGLSESEAEAIALAFDMRDSPCSTSGQVLRSLLEAEAAKIQPRVPAPDTVGAV